MAPHVMGNVFDCRPKQYPVLFAGLHNSGKTQALYSLMPDASPAVSPTMAFNLETVVIDNAKLQITDTGGNDKWARPLGKHFWQGQKAVVFFVDSSDAVARPNRKRRKERS